MKIVSFFKITVAAFLLVASLRLSAWNTEGTTFASAAPLAATSQGLEARVKALEARLYKGESTQVAVTH